MGSPVGSAMLAQVGQVIVATFIVWQLAFVDGCGPQKPPPKRPPVNFTCGTGLDEERDGQRIIGGDEAEQHSIPWQVALVSYWSGGKPFCGGTIISPFHILTAAHCTFVPAIYVRVGEHDITTHNDNSTLHKVACITDHPTYNGKPMDNDFAVITLEEPLDLTSNKSFARAACLPPDNPEPVFVPNVTMFTVSGWGLMEEGGEDQPQVLHHVQVPHYNRDICSKAYTNHTDYPEIITENMLCAGHADGGIDSCQGDSGGPLTWNDGGVETVVGVVSWGIGCGRPELPGVYSRVSKQVEWIKSLGIEGQEARNKCPPCQGILCIFG